MKREHIHDMTQIKILRPKDAGQILNLVLKAHSRPVLYEKLNSTLNVHTSDSLFYAGMVSLENLKKLEILPFPSLLFHCG